MYSWVPPEVRDALFALAAQRLAPDGILYVSFNVLPGCRVRQAAWDVLHHHVDHIEDPRARFDAARELARLVADGGTATHESDQALRAEFRAIAQHSDSELAHDDLAVPNEPVFFDTFVAHAARHGLRYLAEADVQTMGVDRNFRRRRTALLVHARSRSPASNISTSSGCAAFASRCSFAPTRRPTRRSTRSACTPCTCRRTWRWRNAAATGGVHKLARRLDPAAGGGGAVRKLLDALVAKHPATLRDRIARATASISARCRDLSKPSSPTLTAGASSTCTCIRRRSRSGRSDRPVASPLARLQARTRDSVTTLLHTQVGIADANALRLLPLVDGTRDRAALASAVRQIAVDIDPSRAPDFVNYALEKFARLGLLQTEQPTAASVNAVNRRC